MKNSIQLSVVFFVILLLSSAVVAVLVSFTRSASSGAAQLTGAEALVTLRSNSLMRFATPDRADQKIIELMPELEKDCTLDPGIPCVYLSQAYETGSGGIQDTPLARRLLQRGCAALSATACAQLGRVYRDGVGGEANDELAELHFAQACRLHNADACSVIGNRLLSKTGAEQDLYMAIALLSASCALGGSDDCKQVDTLLSDPKTKKFADEAFKHIESNRRAAAL